MSMTQRARFLGTLLGTGADRFPLFDLEPAEETVERWRREGLPASATVAEAFDLETHHPVDLNLRSSPRYRGPPERLADPEFLARHYDPDTPSRYADRYAERCEEARAAGRVIYVDAWAGGLLQMLGVGDWPSLEAALLDPPALEVAVQGVVAEPAVPHHHARRTGARVHPDTCAAA